MIALRRLRAIPLSTFSHPARTPLLPNAYTSVLTRRASALQSRRRAFNSWREPPDAPQPVSAVRRILSLEFLRRWAVLSAGSVFILGAFLLCGYQGVQVWVEVGALAPERNSEVKRWQWEQELDDWGGGHERGGTDSRLGFWNQHLVRIAFLHENYGAPERIEDYRRLSRAILELVVKKISEKDPNSLALPPLYLRLAAALERNQHPDDLVQAAECYRLALKATETDGFERPRVQIRLGNVYAALGDTQSARELWQEAIQSCSRKELAPGSLVPDKLPSPPVDQRTLLTALQSYSGSLSSSGEFDQAIKLQQAARSLLNPPTFPDVNNTTPPEMLHDLYLAHRAALFTIHLAEVSYAQSKRPPPVARWLAFGRPAENTTPLELLHTAAEYSERVALALQGLEYAYIPPQSASDGSLIKPFATASRAVNKPAKALLRDARRSAAQAWRLSGIVNRENGDGDRALECFTRALAWAGPGEPAPDTLESEWRAISDAYAQTKEQLLALK
ncbi:hypothetical protein BKA62DRAFT_684477 [Auriculariales sp. MPI-PUGE-AT-0066]|nr:hypothetical protein BKA62DRAFT_684477 [Auriculariales sp. MPI-PUGE-AT-0066]